MRDEFPVAVKDVLAKRVGLRCSNPDCRQSTSGPQVDPAKAINIGVAAHITAASPDGPRYDPALTAEQRCAAENGIWLCQNDGKLVDNDSVKYSPALLREWKRIAEQLATLELESPKERASGVQEKRKLMFELTDEDPACFDEGDSPTLGHYKNCKVVVRNGSGASIDEVHVSLERFKEIDLIPTWLRSRRLPLRPEFGDHLDPQWSKNLAPGEKLVVGVFGVDTVRPDCFRLYHLATGMDDRLEFGEYHIEIQVIGRNVQPVTRVARIGRDASGKPFLKFVSV